MSGRSEDIVEAAISRIVLKCEVKQNHAPPPIAATKIAQKVTLLPSSSPCKAAQPKGHPEEAALAAVARGNAEYTRGAYQSALAEYAQALPVFEQLRSRRYYGVLAKMAECQKRLRRYHETRRLYEEISLVNGGSF